MSDIQKVEKISVLLVVFLVGTGVIIGALAARGTAPVTEGGAVGGLPGAAVEPGEVTTSTIADSAVTLIKLAPEVTARLMSEGGVTASYIGTGAVTSDKILDGTIAGADISDGTITDSDIVSSGISRITIGNGTITGALLADNISVAGEDNLTIDNLVVENIYFISGQGASIIIEGTADAFETTIAVTDPTADRIVTLANATGTVMLSTLATNAPDVANSVTGGTNQLIMEGATADAFETILTPADATVGDATITIPDTAGVAGTVMLSTLATNAFDIANSVWGGTNQLIMEGATANAFETILTPADATVGDATITIPDTAGVAQTLITGDGSYAIARGTQAVTGTSADVDTGLGTVVECVVSIQVEAAPGVGNVLATWGDGSAAGLIDLYLWKPTGAADCTLIAGTVAGNVSWVAIGTA